MSPRDDRFDEGPQASAAEWCGEVSPAHRVGGPATVATPEPAPPGGSAGERVLVWILCDTELLEAHAVEQSAAQAFMRERMSALSDDDVTRTAHPIHWSVVYRGRLKDRRPGYLQAYEVPFAPGTVEIRESLDDCPRVTFGSDTTGRIWTRQVPGFQRLHDGQWDPADRDGWLAWAGFAPSDGGAWDFAQDAAGTLVASAWSGVVRLGMAA